MNRNDTSTDSNRDGQGETRAGNPDLRSPGRRAGLWTLVIILLGLLAGQGCESEKSAPTARGNSKSTSTPVKNPTAGRTKPPANARYTDRRNDFNRARSMALAWLDALEVDTAHLQANGVKGKKKLGEILAAYWAYYKYSVDNAEKERLLERVHMLSDQVHSPEYQNLLECSDVEFRQNSMSFFRVLALQNRFGLDTREYMEEVRRVQPRFDSAMAERGEWQRAMFASYYDRFGLEKPPSLLTATMDHGMVSRRIRLETYYKNIQVPYQLTHEVYVSFDYGNKATQDRFNEQDLAYLRYTLPRLAAHYIKIGNPDILAEVLSCMTYLRMTTNPRYNDAINDLLNSQNPNGSWGTYSRQKYGEYVDQRLYLHTTTVAIKALIQAYSGKWD